MQLHPYLCFEGRADEAITYYCDTLGAELVSIMRASEAPPDACCSEGGFDPNGVLHAHLKIGTSELFVSDGMSNGKCEFKGFHMALTLADEKVVEALFNRISTEGQVVVPLGQSFFASAFGMVNDKFGLTWSLMVPLPAHTL